MKENVLFITEIEHTSSENTNNFSISIFDAYHNSDIFMVKTLMCLPLKNEAKLNKTRVNKNITR